MVQFIQIDTHWQNYFHQEHDLVDKTKSDYLDQVEE